jgi:hypothetical protein
MTPVIHNFTGTSPSIVIGTGGETLGGNLYRISLDDLVKGDISHAQILKSEEERGFIAPPTIADLNNDSVDDIIVNWFGGKMIAIDGKDNSILWEREIPNSESYNTAVPGFFNSDEVPDFFSTYNRGTWPNNEGSVQVMIDGKNGEVIFSDSLGCIGYSSGVTVDTNDDGFDEVIFSVNDFRCKVPAYVGSDLPNDRHILYLLDYHNNKLTPITDPVQAKNVSSTPWIGDLDGDQLLDVVYCSQHNDIKADQFSGFSVSRIETNFKITHQPTWNSYLGDHGNGILKGKRK